jgi:hypothetical protein
MQNASLGLSSVKNDMLSFITKTGTVTRADLFKVFGKTGFFDVAIDSLVSCESIIRVYCPNSHSYLYLAN